jgi:hypothetical protein
MKKLSSSIFFLFLVIVANAQFKSGQKLFGPTFSIAANSNSTDYQTAVPNYNDDSRTSFGAGIGLVLVKLKTESVGYGWGINYGYSHVKDESSSANASPYIKHLSKSNSHDVGLTFFRRKFYTIAPKFNFYYDAGIRVNAVFQNQDYTHTDNTSTPAITTSESEYKGYGANLYLTPGFTYIAKKNLLLEAALNSAFSIGYSHTDGTSKQSVPTTETTFKNSTFNLNSSLIANGLLHNITFSVKWIL